MDMAKTLIQLLSQTKSKNRELRALQLDGSKAAAKERPWSLRPFNLIASRSAVRDRRVEQLLFPQECNAASAGVLHNYLGNLLGALKPRPITLPLRGHCQPCHHVGAGADHALD